MHAHRLLAMLERFIATPAHRAGLVPTPPLCGQSLRSVGEPCTSVPDLPQTSHWPVTFALFRPSRLRAQISRQLRAERRKVWGNSGAETLSLPCGTVSSRLAEVAVLGAQQSSVH